VATSSRRWGSSERWAPKSYDDANLDSKPWHRDSGPQRQHGGAVLGPDTVVSAASRNPAKVLPPFGTTRSALWNTGLAAVSYTARAHRDERSCLAPTVPCSRYALRASCLPQSSCSALCSLVLGLRPAARALARPPARRGGEGARLPCAGSARSAPIPHVGALLESAFHGSCAREAAPGPTPHARR
jgi:hypothetical protein